MLAFQPHEGQVSPPHIHGPRRLLRNIQRPHHERQVRFIRLQHRSQAHNLRLLERRPINPRPQPKTPFLRLHHRPQALGNADNLRIHLQARRHQVVGEFQAVRKIGRGFDPRERRVQRLQHRAHAPDLAGYGAGFFARAAHVGGELGEDEGDFSADGDDGDDAGGELGHGEGVLNFKDDLEEGWDSSH